MFQTLVEKQYEILLKDFEERAREAAAASTQSDSANEMENAVQGD